MSEPKGRILLIDPNDTYRAYLSTLLKEKNYTVIEGSNFSQAAERLSRSHFDCVILDTNMPDTHGCDAVPIVKDINKKLKVILMTDKNSKDLEARVRELDVYYFFIKSFPTGELFLAIDNVFKARERKEAIGYIGKIRLSLKKTRSISFKEQTEKITEFCEEENIRLLEVVKEKDCDARLFDRPGIIEVIKKCPDVDIVVVERPWCIARRSSILEDFLQVLKTYNVKLLCATHMWDCSSQFVRRFYYAPGGRQTMKGSGAR